MDPVPRWPPLHERYDRALRILAGLDVGYAEAWRALIPLSERIDEPRPSYWRVRRFLAEERLRRAETREEVEEILSLLLAGLVMPVAYRITK